MQQCERFNISGPQPLHLAALRPQPLRIDLDVDRNLHHFGDGARDVTDRNLEITSEIDHFAGLSRRTLKSCHTMPATVSVT